MPTEISSLLIVKVRISTKTFQVRKLTCSGKEEPKWQLTALPWLSAAPGIHRRKRLRFYEINLAARLNSIGAPVSFFFPSPFHFFWFRGSQPRDFYETTSRPPGSGAKAEKPRSAKPRTDLAKFRAARLRAFCPVLDETQSYP